MGTRSGDLDPAVGNADGNPEIFIWRKDTATFHQLTDTPAGVVNQEPFASDSGKCIVFASNGNFDNNTGQDSSIPATNNTNVDGSTEFWPFQRDPETLARPWAVPGTPGLEHRIGGIEKADGTVYGDGVNIAARLQGLAEPGGIASNFSGTPVMSLTMSSNTSARKR